MLNHISIFKGIPEQALAGLEQQLIKRQYKKNIVLFSEGDHSDSLYLIESGTVKVFVTGDDGRQVTLGFQGVGDCFGELALLDGQPRSASVITLEPSTFMILPRVRFEHFLNQHPQLSGTIMASLSKRIRHLTDSVKDLALLDVYGRIAHLFQQIASEESQIKHKLTHQEIANIVGASREMVSRIMRELSIGGYIEQTSQGPVILKPLPRGW